MGDESLLVQCGVALRERAHTVRAIITESAGVADWATGEGLAVYTPEALLAGALELEPFDWFFSIANLRIVPKRVWQLARSGAVNFHDGPLPRYAGLNTPAWALLAGETEYAVTWHLFGAGIDDGDILVQAPVAIEAEDTSLTLNTKCFEAGIASFSDLLSQIERGALDKRVQDEPAGQYFGRHQRPDDGATIDPLAPAAAADRLLRALNFGRGYSNPLSLGKIATRHGAFNVVDARVETTPHAAAPGTVLRIDGEGAHVALSDGELVVSALSDWTGTEVKPAQVLSAGETLCGVDPAAAADLNDLVLRLAKGERRFAERIIAFSDLDLTGVRPETTGATPAVASLDLGPSSVPPGHAGVAAVLGYLVRMQGDARISIALADDALTVDARAWRGYVAPVVPFVLEPSAGLSVEDLRQRVADEFAALRELRGFSSDLVSRLPGVDRFRPSFGLVLAGSPETADLLAGTAVTIAVPEKHGRVRLLYDQTRFSEADASAMARRLAVFGQALSQSPVAPVASLPVMTQAELHAVIVEANATQRDYSRDALVHGLFADQARRTPDAVALVCDGQSVTYAELDRRSSHVAAALVSAGAGPHCLIGLYMRRSAELVVGALAILKSGGAYVPLDPTYPPDRLAFMISDSKCPIVLTTEDLKAAVPDPTPRHVTIEEALRDDGHVPAVSSQGADSLAYVIYTSGSTGQPKGVMVEHRNVVNFFAGMDDRIDYPSSSQPVWLAVTSLSFDISVLELFWTLTRGFKVVVLTDKPALQATEHSRRRASRVGGMDFSLFYWGNDDAAGALKYQLLLDGARFADTHGFCAVWTPERHFHAFGGPYPNPAVTGAAVAAVTRNLDIRAGSCVLPLHHVARVAEEWAVIDNLSNGRAGLALAAGWMPEDFLLRPENAPPNNKTAMLNGLETLRQLWRGEAVGFEAPGGKIVNVVTQPRPVQRDLPIWVTTAGNPDTYREAARHGAHVLTHLLGQSIAEVGDKIRIYREALAECGRNPDDYKVTLMLHTLVGSDRDEVRELARGPMKDYLKSAAALIKQYAWAFPAFKKPAGMSNPNEVDLQSLDPEELDAIIEFAFLRYFDDSGLFGTVQDALDRVAQVKAIGVDEIACLIDFGVPRSSALSALEPLAKVVAGVNGSLSDVIEESVDGSIGGLIRQYDVSHLQCTPSMAAMILSNDEDRAALARVSHLFIGGEALPGSLLADLATATRAEVVNMYGPTETTIWSATHRAEPTEGVVPLGTPIANTQLYILDNALRPVPDGVAGELFIGGDGVTRGYLNRDALTRERFLANPFVADGRIYRTGDLVRRGASGALDFLGRVDFQVKVRGYRIELGEIEACLNKHPGVTDSVVIAREDKPGDIRLVAYVRPLAGRVAEGALREHVRATLPDYMVPAHFVSMAAFPLTPNAKIDRKALPKPGDAVLAVSSQIAFVAPTEDVEIRIADAFKRALGVEKIGTLDNFFALGGHSLLAVQVHRELKKSVASNLSITDIYRFPTVGGLAAHILDRGQASKDLGKVADRAAMRRNALAARRPLQRT